MQHDQKMVEHVGRFADQAVAVLARRCDHGLDRLFAELLGALRCAPVEQLARVGFLGRRLGALIDALLKIADGKFAHTVQ
jgi:hypothetical protein